jgi:sterol desaturase/sphingolipid hydroxylase (fatty acid hydroxylase superfamily)
MEVFTKVTIIPSLACTATFFWSCFVFDFIYSFPEVRQLYRIQPQVETSEKIREMRNVAIKRLVDGFWCNFLCHWVARAILTTDDFGALNLWYEFACLVIMLLLSDANFYWSHRLLHHRWFYQSCHKLHHSCKHPIPWTSLYVDVGEFFIAILSSFLLPLWVAGLLGLQPNYHTYSLYLIIITFSLVMSHDGMNLPFLSAEHHDQHHEMFHGNYGSRLNFWDRLMNTEIKLPQKNSS